MQVDINKGPDGYYITLAGPEPATYFYPALIDALAELYDQVWAPELKSAKVEVSIYEAAADDIRTLLGEAGMEKWLDAMGLSGSPGDQEGAA